MYSLIGPCEPLISAYTLLSGERLSSYMDFYLLWHNYAAKSLAWLYAHSNPKTTLDMTIDKFFSTINLNSFLKVRWPFTISNSLVNKLSKLPKKEVEKILESIESIAWGHLNYQNVVATGPCVYRCSLIEPISNHGYILFSINPIFDPLNNCAKQYLRFDFWLKERPNDFCELNMKSLRELEAIDPS